MERQFFKTLDDINNDLIQMGALCQKGLGYLTSMLTKHDTANLLALRDNEKKVDRLEASIESKCQRLLLLEQPVAQDLRQIYATIKIINDLERISDQTLSIGTLSEQIDEGVHLLEDLLAQITAMVALAIESYTTSLREVAQRTIAKDEAVNRLFASVKENLARELPHSIESSLNQLMIAKYMEGIGDHAKSIATIVLEQITPKES
ncbi:MAG: phosphate signaling complex protein PhoU [Streptococcaceae bacterium]|jgi:phosphate transport system protein|nr:phosphate signaling complex protein PhoU [Streptococcaceae bacterium]